MKEKKGKKGKENARKEKERKGREESCNLAGRTNDIHLF